MRLTIRFRGTIRSRSSVRVRVDALLTFGKVRTCQIATPITTQSDPKERNTDDLVATLGGHPKAGL